MMAFINGSVTFNEYHKQLQMVQIEVSTCPTLLSLNLLSNHLPHDILHPCNSSVVGLCKPQWLTLISRFWSKDGTTSDYSAYH